MNCLKFLLLMHFIANANAAINVITVDENGIESVSQISNIQYKSHVKNSIQAITESVDHALKTSETSSDNWYLKTISVGLGLSGTVGLGPYNLGTTVRQRFNYEK